MVLVLAKKRKYDETTLLDKMAEETSLLQQAFAEIGVQLNKIIDAYKRKKHESDYPRFVSFVYDGDIQCLYKINENLTIEIIEGYVGDAASPEGDRAGIYCREEDNSIVIVDCHSDMENPDPNVDINMFSYDKTSFELTNLLDDGTITLLQWIDSSTI